MNQIKQASNISILMEKIYDDRKDSVSPIVETLRIGDKMYGIVTEGNKYVIKETRFVEGKEYIKNDFKYINGIQNRTKYLSETIIGAKKKLNFILNENVHSEQLNEDKKYVIKQDAPNLEPDAEFNQGDQDIDMDMKGENGASEDETAEDIETDLDEYQELTGKLSYILRNQDEGQYDDVAKYIFNSLIAALDVDKLDSNVADSMKEKFLSKFENEDSGEGEEDNGGDEDNIEETLSRIEEPYPGEKNRHVNSDSVVDVSLVEENLKKKGYKITERFSKEGLIAFMGQKDVSGVFNQPTKRYEDGEVKNPLEKEGIHAIGDSAPYDEKEDPNKMEQKDEDKPFTESMQWEEYEEDYGDLEIAQKDQDWKRKRGLNTPGMPSASTLGYDADETIIDDDMPDESPYGNKDYPTLEELLSDSFIEA